MKALVQKQESLQKVFELTLLFYVFSMVSMYLSVEHGSIALIWLPNAISVAYLLRSKPKEWLQLIFAIVYASFISNLVYGTSLDHCGFYLLASLSEIVFCAGILTFLKVPDDFEYRLSSTTKLLLVSVILAPTVSATVISSLMLYYRAPFISTWLSWYVGSAIGMLTILPFALAFSQAKLLDALSKPKIFRNLLLFSLTLLATYFSVDHLSYPFVYSILMPLLTATLSDVFTTSAISAGNVIFVYLLIHLGLFEPSMPYQMVFNPLDYVPIAMTTLPPLIISISMEHLRKEKQLVDISEAQFRDAMEYSAIGMALVGLDGRWLRVNQSLCKILGYTQEELMKLSFQDITYADDLDMDLSLVQQVIEGKINNYQLEKRYFCKNGNLVWVLLAISLVRNPQGQPQYFVSQIEDIDFRKKAENEKALFANQLYEEKERLHVTLYSIGDGVLTTDKLGNISFLNPIAEILTGWTHDEALGKPHEIVLHLVNGESDTPLISPIKKCLAKGRVIHSEENTKLINKNGIKYDVTSSAATVRAVSGEIIGSVLVFQNITKSRQMARELSYNATHDQLTDLYNRSKFEQILNEALRTAKEQKIYHTICYLNLDGFKILNDSAGHSAGDLLLQTLSNLLRKQIRTTDVIARVGGDEFALLLYGCDTKEGSELSEHLIEIISEMRFPWEGHYYQVGASVGIVKMDEHTLNASEILSRADIACYAAKKAGRRRVSVYQPGQSEAEKQHRDILLVSNMHEAIEHDRFILYAQEIVSIIPNDPNKANRHFELLLRLRDNGNVILPNDFIPAAERFGLIANIDRWVLQEALVKLAPSIAKVEGLSIGINLSGYSLNEINFLPHLVNLIEHSPIPAAQIHFEITETALMHHISTASDTFVKLRELGCKVALDDFGSGFSSLNYLKNFSVDIIKIDGSFIHNITHNLLDEAIATSVNQIAHQIGALTVAEYVESDEILNHIKKIGIDYAQGFGLHRPEPFKYVIERLSHGKRANTLKLNK